MVRRNGPDNAGVGGVEGVGDAGQFSREPECLFIAYSKYVSVDSRVHWGCEKFTGNLSVNFCSHS